MRTSIILVRAHDAKTFSLFKGPEVALLDQKATIRELLAASEHSEFAEAQIWESDSGLQRSLRFHTPENAKAIADKRAADNAKMEATHATAKNKAEKPPVKPSK